MLASFVSATSKALSLDSSQNYNPEFAQLLEKKVATF
jgi:hypothetical protein